MALTHKLGLAALLSASPFAVFAQSAPLTDPQIAAIVVTANQVDIDAGALAANKAHAKQVQDFAKLMVTDHGNVNKSAVELATRLNLKPEGNATSEALKKEGDGNTAALNKLAGEAFDKAYIRHEVAYHEEVLNAVDKALIPSAKNEELKALLVKVRPAFVAHLEHARAVESALGGDRGKAIHY
jgi:putative membrane protein